MSPLVPLLLLVGACVGARLAPGAHRVTRQAAPRGANITLPCLECICRARHCDWDFGCRNEVCGGYQISEPYFVHSNITGEVSVYADRTYQSCTTDVKCATTVVELYMSKEATDCDKSGDIDCDDMMMTHFFGNEGCIGARGWVEFTDDWRRYRRCITKAN